jgi:septum formation protein
MPADLRLVLASGSAARRRLLTAAGVAFTVEAAQVDESAVKMSLSAAGAPVEDAAVSLGELKAMRVSNRLAGVLVLGSDQMLECDGLWYDKPVDRSAARHQLIGLRGRTHRLVTSAVLVRDGARLWHTVAINSMTMRRFDDAFLDGYLAEVGDDVTSTVGGYQIEGRGIQLFASIDGDPFAIQGLPLLPVLDMLRRHGVLAG